MEELEKLKKEIEQIKQRNKEVESAKAWELSWQRKIIILALTYIGVLSVFISAEIPKPFANAIIPTIAFALSTLSLPFFRKYWLRGRR